VPGMRFGQDMLLSAGAVHKMQAIIVAVQPAATIWASQPCRGHTSLSTARRSSAAVCGPPSPSPTLQVQLRLLPLPPPTQEVRRETADMRRLCPAGTALLHAKRTASRVTTPGIVAAA
jgi:hypothetical protein